MDTYTRSNLAFPTRTHPTQGIIPFSVVQSLRLCIPFQCYSWYAVRNNQPSRSLSEVPHALGLSSNLPLPLLTGSDQSKVHNSLDQNKNAHNSKKCICWAIYNTWTTKNEFQMGKNTRGEENDFKIILLLHRGKIDLYKNPTQQIDFTKWLGEFWV